MATKDQRILITIATGMVADTLRRALVGAGYDVAMARSGEEAQAGTSDGNLASLFKYFGTEQNKRKYELMLQSMGTRSIGWEGASFTDRELNTTRQWLRSKANSIEGGTSEVQLNVIAKRVLGLPD